MTRRRVAALLIVVALPLSACQGGGGRPAPLAVPTLEYRTNSQYSPGHVSTCAGGQPQLQYNCSEDRY